MSLSDFIVPSLISDATAHCVERVCKYVDGENYALALLCDWCGKDTTLLPLITVI